MIFGTHKTYTQCVERAPLDPNIVGARMPKIVLVHILRFQLDISWTPYLGTRVASDCRFVVAFDGPLFTALKRNACGYRREQCGNAKLD